MTQEFPRTPMDLLHIAALPFVYLALGAWYLVAVPLAIGAWVVVAILLMPQRPRRILQPTALSDVKLADAD